LENHHAAETPYLRGLGAGFATQLTLARAKQPAKKGETKAYIGTSNGSIPFRQLIPKTPAGKDCRGFIWTEGAVWYKPGKCLLFSDIPNNVVSSGNRAKAHPKSQTIGLYRRQTARRQSQ